MQTKKVLLVGGSGFIGGYVASRLSSAGLRVTIPTRRRERAKTLIMLPGVDVVEANIHDTEQLEALVAGQDAVINLVGILHSSDVRIPYGSEFAEAHVDLPVRLLAACKKHNVRRLLHMSALNAGELIDGHGVSEYLSSKGDGEAAVLAAAQQLAVTVLRPSVVFGLGDNFMTMFAHMAALYPRSLPTALKIFPLGCATARFQPVWVGDVAAAFVSALENPATFGQRYDLCGDKIYSLQELVAYAAAQVGVRLNIVALGEGLSYLQAGLLSLLPTPLMSPDNLRSMRLDSVCSGRTPVFPDWQPQALEAIVPGYISHNSPGDRMAQYRNIAGR